MSEDQELAQIEAELLALEAAVIEAVNDGPIIEPAPEPVAEKPKKTKKPKKEPAVESVKVPDPVEVKKDPVLFGAAKLKAKFLKR